jgi:hypothetical protein
MFDSHKLAVVVRAQRDCLDGRRLVFRHRIHLRARELDADRPVDRLGGNRGHQRMRPHIGFPAEPAADELRIRSSWSGR